MADGESKTPWWKRAWFGWLVLAFGVGERVIGWGGSIDFIVSRSKDPGWVGGVLKFVSAQSAYFGFALILGGVALIVLAERRRSEKQLEAVKKTIGQQRADAPATGSRQKLFPDWSINDVVRGLASMEGYSSVPEGEDDRKRLALRIADTIHLNGLAVWGRRDGKVLQRVDDIWDLGRFSVAKDQSILAVPTRDTIYPSLYTDLCLDKSQAEEYFWTVITIEDDLPQ